MYKIKTVDPVISDNYVFSKTQNEMYKKVLCGLNGIDEGTLKSMTQEDKRAIKKRHSKAQYVLNVWKQELSAEIVNNLVKTLFPKSRFFADSFGTYTDPSYFNTLQFKDLGISKVQIVNKLIKEGLLPEYFYQIK